MSQDTYLILVPGDVVRTNYVFVAFNGTLDASCGLVCGMSVSDSVLCIETKYQYLSTWTYELNLAEINEEDKPIKTL